MRAGRNKGMRYRLDVRVSLREYGNPIYQVYLWRVATSQKPRFWWNLRQSLATGFTVYLGGTKFKYGQINRTNNVQAKSDHGQNHGAIWLTKHDPRPWSTMIYHELPCQFTVFYHGPMVFTMVIHGRPWEFMVDHGRPWWILSGKAAPTVWDFGPRIIRKEAIIHPIHTNFTQHAQTSYP